MVTTPFYEAIEFWPANAPQAPPCGRGASLFTISSFLNKKAVMIHGLFSVGIGQKAVEPGRGFPRLFLSIRDLAMDEPLPYVPPPAPVFSYRNFPLHLLAFQKKYHYCNNNWVLCQS